ncbi:MAG: hypothetical protein PHP37_03355 [Patescibacteria group bacterium]|nr:hypothetical protein [Patescibacteria group bacterium]
MKKIIVLVIVMVAMATTVFGQKVESPISSKKLYEMRAKEIDDLKKGLPRKVQLAPEDLARIDSFYLPQIKRAEDREAALLMAKIAPTVTPPATPTKKKVVTYSEVDSAGTVINSSASSETPVNLPPPVPTPASRKTNGSTVAYQGDQGAFSGNSPSVIRGAEAYATVATADANAYLVRQMANGATATVSAPANHQVGLEGTIINKYRFYELEVKIVGTNAGNVYNKTFLLGKDQSITDYLLPGTYQATIKAIGVDGIIFHNFVVAPNQINSVNGRNVFWVIYGGSAW